MSVRAPTVIQMGLIQMYVSCAVHSGETNKKLHELVNVLVLVLATPVTKTYHLLEYVPLRTCLNSKSFGCKCMFSSKFKGLNEEMDVLVSVFLLVATLHHEKM